MVRRHRYETAYIERNVEGYYPVEVVRGPTPKFSLILRGDDGKLYRKTWVVEGYMVRKVERGTLRRCLRTRSTAFCRRVMQRASGTGRG